MSKNVLGGTLEICGINPKTGYFRTGACETGPGDTGSHVICAQVSEKFLSFTKKMGNDLTRPVPAEPGSDHANPFYIEASLLNNGCFMGLYRTFYRQKEEYRIFFSRM